MYLFLNPLFIIVLLCIVIVVVFVVVYGSVANSRERAQANKFAYERAFYDVGMTLVNQIQILVDARTLEPRYIAGDTERLLGLSSREVSRDPAILTACLEHDKARDLLASMKKWDRSEPFIEEFPYHLAGTQDDRFAKVEMDPTPDGAYLVVVLTDITEEEKIRADLREEIQRALSSEQAKSDFLSSMSHEIRTPMNGIMGMLSLTKLNSEDPEQVIGYTQQAEDLSSYLLSLINDILDMSKIDSGKMDIEQIGFDLFDICNKETELFGGMIESKGVRYVTEIDDFPNHYVMGDPMRLTQVVTNLVSNSYKFTEPGGTIKVGLHNVQSSDDEVHVMFEVSDTGKGMDAAFLTKIFNPFVQESSSTSRQYGGSGLGMAITDSLVHLMGGQVTVESELGKGSVFRVYLTLPVATEEQIAAIQTHKPAAEADMNPAERFTIEGSHILLAEDNDINAKIAVTMLERMGASVDRAEDGQQVCDLFEKSPIGSYDLVLLDIQMPALTGWQAAERIRAFDREDARTVPLFALSANVFSEDIQHSLDVGMDGHLAKPLDFSSLEMRVNEGLMLR